MTTAECANKQTLPSNNDKNNKVLHHHHKPKDVFAELSCAGCKAAQVLVLKQRISNLRDRVEALEKRAHKEKIKQNKFVLRELVKEARTRILEVNGIPQPSSKQSWKYCLHNLTAQQLQHANVNVKLWPELVEVLSPSAAKLNDWVHGYTTWQAARVIGGMTPTMQAIWAELFKMTHKGANFEHYAAMEEPTMAKELQEED